MAHALRRVSLSTARPADAQFAFVSHNPGSVDAQLYCHVFQARHARAVSRSASIALTWRRVGEGGNGRRPALLSQHQTCSVS